MDNKGKKGGIFKILLPIGIFIIVVMIAFGGSKKSSAGVINASADSTTVFIPDNSYMIHTFYNPQIYVSWSNNGNYTTLLYPPVLYITPSSYQCSFGDSLYTLSSSYTTGIECQSWQVQAQNPNTPNGYELYFVGSITGGGFSPSELYNGLFSGEYYISRVRFYNQCGTTPISANGFRYAIYVKNSQGLESWALNFSFERNESVPSSIPALYFDSEDNVDFSYTFSFNGNSTGQASYDEGYRAGHTVGYTEGYNVGVDDEYSFLNLFTAVLDAPLTTFKSLLNFNLLGINILSFATSIITAVILIKVLKLILGG